MFSYAAYGLGIHSNFALPELLESDADPDVFVRLGRVAAPDASASATAADHVLTGKVRLFGRTIASFSVQEGREIVVDPVAPVNEEALRLFVTGAGFGTLLVQRGLAVLHASSIVVSSGAVIFLGHGGSGKSTLAAAMHARGHALLADDVVAIEMTRGGALRALPGFPECRLRPDSVKMLDHDPDKLPKLHGQVEKRALRISTGFAAGSAPLRCVYLLHRGESTVIEPVSPKDALFRMLPHWHATRTSDRLVRAVGISTLFDQCARIAEEVPVFGLAQTRSPGSLPRIVSMVEEHLAEIVERPR